MLRSCPSDVATCVPEGIYRERLAPEISCKSLSLHRKFFIFFVAQVRKWRFIALPAASKSRFTYNCCIHLEGLSSAEKWKLRESKLLKKGAYLTGELRDFFNIHPMYICSNGVYFCYMWGMLSTGNAQIAVGGRAQGNAVQTS